MNHLQMRPFSLKQQYKLAPLFTVLLLSGCQLFRSPAPKPTFTPVPAPVAIETTAVNNQVDSEALQTAVKALTAQMINAPEVQTITKTTQPLLYVEPFKNGTSEYADIALIQQTILQQIKESSHFIVVDESKVTQLRNELHLSQTDEFASSATAVRFVSRTGAKYMLTGKISAGDAESYTMRMQLLSLESGAIEWSDSQPVSKSAINGTGW